MTVSTTTSRADYTGNGVTTAFAVPFYFLDNTHLKVLRTQISTGVITTLVLSSDYTLSGAGVAAGGTLTCTSAPTSDQKLSILRNVPLTQLVHYVPNDPFPAATHEQALDQLTMEVQQVNEVLSRALTLPASTTGISTSLPSAAPLQLIGFNGTGTALTTYDPASIITVAGSSGFSTQSFSGTGAQTTFTLSTSPGLVANLEVFISGVRQRPTTDYSVSGTTLTFVSAPASGTNNILARWGLTLGIGVPNDGSVTAAKLAVGAAAANLGAGSVTSSMLASGAAVTNIGYTPANDSATVHTTGNETIGGTKTFSAQPVLPQAATLATAQLSTSGTFIDFTSIPSWVKRVTVMFNNVSTNGVANVQVQLASAGTVETTGYGGSVFAAAGGSVGTAAFSTGFATDATTTATDTRSGAMILTLTGVNLWTAMGSFSLTNTSRNSFVAGTKQLVSSLDRVRITTANGVDAFDTGSINILYE